MTEQELREEVQRGEHAKQILAEPLMSAAFDSVEAALVKKWRETAPADARTWERCHLALHIIGSVKAVLETHIKNGKLAAADLTKIIGKQEFEKRGFLRRAS